MQFYNELVNLWYGDKVKQVREGCEMTQTKFANVFDITQASISQIEAGKRLPSTDLLNNIQEYCDIPEDFFDDEKANRWYLLKVVKGISPMGIQKVIEYAELIKKAEPF